MDIYKAIAQLREEKRRLDLAIERLEENGRSNGDRPRRRAWNSGARRAAAERMRKYWEQRKQAKAAAATAQSVRPPSTDSV